MVESARLFMSGTDARGRPLILRVELAGDELRVAERSYVDPAVRSGRGTNPGVISGLAQIGDCRGGQWLLATVERGRPRLIDPDGLGIVALLGRRREWRGAAEVRGPYLPIRCDRPPRLVGGQSFALSRSPAGAFDLLRVLPGAPVERWYLGELGRRVELLAGESSLVLVAGDRLASIALADLVPGGEPLTDPRDVELSLNWRTLPNIVVAGVLAGDAGVWLIEREGDRYFVATRELESMNRLCRWPIARPQRWLSSADSLWVAGRGSWTRIAANEGACDRLISPSPIIGPCAWSLRDDPWLWWWSNETATLHRASGRSLAGGSIASWALDRATTQLRRVEQLLVADPLPAGQRATVVHADELAELLALEPSLAGQWRACFD